jgi:hypothetical protein
MDRTLAGGLEVEGTFTPTELYAGEADIVTTQEVVNSNQGALAQYQVVALVGGKLIAYDKENGVAGANVPYGVLPHAIPDAAVDQDTPVIIGGVLNFDALVADGATYAVLKAAFAGTNIVIQKLY